jgi:DNA-binding MarR family transcriptional regulator
LAANSQDEIEIYRFISDEIESVPHLEALLLLWNSRPQPWTVQNLAQRLYIPIETVQSLIQNLVWRRLVVFVPGPQEGYRYESQSTDQDQLIAAVDATYRREVVRVSTMIHSKPSSSVREFARAFRFTKERD